MVGLIEKSLLAGLGALTLTRDKVKQFVDKLVEEGEVKPEEAPGVVDRLVSRGEAEREELRKLVRDELDKTRFVASRKDVQRNRRLDNYRPDDNRHPADARLTLPRTTR
jgi:polyhydroxyalkanoate synthesis regulator phasin